jgi:hypothetical protein
MSFRKEHAALWDFVHGVTVALWNTRWHVSGYLSVVPDASRDDLGAPGRSSTDERLGYALRHRSARR